MKFFKGLNLCIIVLMLVALFPAPKPALAQTAAPGGDITRETLFVPGEVVVAFDQALPAAQFTARASALAGEVSAQVVEQFANTALLSFDPAADVPALVEQLAAAEGVRYAEPNYISWIPEVKAGDQGAKLQTVTRVAADGRELDLTVAELLAMRTRKKVSGRVTLAPTYPNDIFNNWGNDWIKQSIVWPTANASPMVCVVDTGVDSKHPELLYKVVNGRDFVNDDAVPNDDNGHGTHVAGTIAAKPNNGAAGMAGISNGKVLAVKVMTAQGWGTDSDIAQGIRFCANNTAVKVINMSLGGAPSRVEYEALDYAINTKKKLVVAAAGNESESWISRLDGGGNVVYNNIFPAAWAHAGTPVYALDDGYEMTGLNNLSSGLISVGAARSPWSGQIFDDSVWVDTNDDGNYWDDLNGNDKLDPNEFDQPYEFFENCAADFSNYGAWVEIVAPGEDIYSTTPKSYPFYMNFVDYIPAGYAWLNGTSMAAPHVAGAAARLWSIHPTWTAVEVANRLQATGDELNLAVDPQVLPDWITSGYGLYHYVDWGSGDAPYCWPTDQGGNYTSTEDMSASRYLNLARAMDRFALVAGAVDASTGLPLVGAQIQVITVPGNAVRATSQLTSNTYNWVDLINLPYLTTHQYNLRVNKVGQTYGYQTYLNLLTDPADNGAFFWNPILMVGVPGSKKEITVVANWYYTDDEPYDLDLYAWLPRDLNGIEPDNSAFVGSGVHDPLSPYNFGPGSLTEFPYTRWFRDGGYNDFIPVESIAIGKSPLGAFPRFWDMTPDDYEDQNYMIALTDYEDGSTLNAADPIIRVWYNGILQKIWLVDPFNPDFYDGYRYYVAFPECDASIGENWWWPMTLYRWGGTFYVDAYNRAEIDCDALVPYTEGGVKTLPQKGQLLRRNQTAVR